MNSSTATAWLFTSQSEGGPWPTVMLEADTALVYAPLYILQEPPRDLHLVFVPGSENRLPIRSMVAFAAILQRPSSSGSVWNGHAVGVVRLYYPAPGKVAPIESKALDDLIKKISDPSWGAQAAANADGSEPSQIDSADLRPRHHSIPVVEAGHDRGHPRSPWCLIFPWKCNPHDPGIDERAVAPGPGPHPFGD